MPSGTHSIRRLRVLDSSISFTAQHSTAWHDASFITAHCRQVTATAPQHHKCLLLAHISEDKSY